MTLRIASYNVNNLFSRARALQLEGFSKQSKTILDDVARLNELLAKPSYAGVTGQKIIALLVKYDFANRNLKEGQRWFSIIEARKKLFSIPKGGKTVELKAKGRADWIGWIHFTREMAPDESIQNTGRVIQAVKADILCLVEVEDRPTLCRFDREILKGIKARYPRNMLIDGNDERGIDVAIASQLPICSVRSHINDLGPDGRNPIFSRDCPEYEVALPDGRCLWVLVNHLKSKGYGAPAANDRKREIQAKRVRAILGRFDLKKELVVVAGDFNDGPASSPLQAIFSTPDLHSALDKLPAGEPRWTYCDGKEQFDHLLLSRPLFDRVTKVGIERRGIYSKNNFKGKFSHFPEVTDSTTHASDHAAVWVDVGL